MAMVRPSAKKTIPSEVMDRLRTELRALELTERTLVIETGTTTHAFTDSFVDTLTNETQTRIRLFECDLSQTFVEEIDGFLTIIVPAKSNGISRHSIRIKAESVQSILVRTSNAYDDGYWLKEIYAKGGAQ